MFLLWFYPFCIKAQIKFFLCDYSYTKYDYVTFWRPNIIKQFFFLLKHWTKTISSSTLHQIDLVYLCNNNVSTFVKVFTILWVFFWEKKERNIFMWKLFYIQSPNTSKRQLLYIYFFSLQLLIITVQIYICNIKNCVLVWFFTE
jgi:hypothetical protein